MNKFKYCILGLIIIIILIFINLFSNRTVINKLKNNLFKIQEFITPTVKIDNEYIVSIINKEAKEKIKELNKLLELNENTNYIYINAKIISTNDIYENIITINKGLKDGLKEGMAAVSNKGLIGIVDTVYQNYSYISLVNNKKISVKITSDDKEYNGNITSYDFIANELIITMIRSDSKIEKGNIVMTNGLGEYIPGGIPIGKVKTVIQDEETSIKSVKVNLYEDLTKIKYLGIIKGVKND